MTAQRHFIHDLIDADIASGRWGTHPDGRPIVHTRFPPEPNGFLHIGHAKSICLNFGLAEQYRGKFNLRFDDTNPSKEDRQYIDSIVRDVRWLGAAFDSGPHAGGLFHASDYFEQMYAFARELIAKGLAYVCELTPDQVAQRRGTPQTPATSPHRDRPTDESLRLFGQMRSGDHPNGAMTLRAKIDLASPNFNLRDPVMYRIVHQSHPHTGDRWCLYPMYDWAHGIEDSLEGITHSICTLEFENHRPLYDWFIDAINAGRTSDGSGPWGKRVHHSQQIEFAKLRPTYTVLSKRNLLKIVEQGLVSGWDDPRMPTLAGLRRRGVPPQAVRALCEDVGVTKVESSIDVARLDNAVRDHLNATASRAMAVLRPLRLVIENWPTNPDGSPVVEMLDFQINPEDPAAGTRRVPFSGHLLIDADDFSADPPKKFHRLAPPPHDHEVRLRWAYFVRCTGFDTDPATGRVTAVRCTYDPATRGGDAPTPADGSPPRRPKGTIHWLSAAHAVPAEVRLFERLFSAEHPGQRTGDWADDLNPDSRHVVHGFVESWAADNLRFRPDPLTGGSGDCAQFERLGYFAADPDSGPRYGGSGAHDRLVLNRVVALKDSRADTPEPGPSAVRVYTHAEAARELRIKADRLPEALASAAMAPISASTPLSLEQVRALREHLKKHPLPKA
ncbi:MAG: glutamine--tRNA ligase [Planctomyces sp.]|nr:glutamine--tRNA ligase [Planctomyces sp.]